MKARLRLRRLPELRRAPRSLRNLLVHMLRENPENRPQDPVAFEDEIRKCLTTVERRQAIGRKLGIPLAAVVPRKSKEGKESRTPLAQIGWGVAAFVLLILAMGAAGAFFFPDRIPFLHRAGNVGVPVGVPDASSSAPIVANQPITNASPAPPNSNQNPPSEINAPNPGATAPAQIASANQRLEPEPPTEGPDQNASARQGNVEASTSVSRDAASESASSDSSNARSKRSTATAATSRSTSTSPHITRALPYNEEAETTPPHRGSVRAQVIGATPDGRKILRLPSGRVVFARSRSDDEDALGPRPRRRIYTERPDIYAPPGYFPND